MKKILLTACIVACAASVNAQFAYDYLRAADSYFKKGDYYSAATYYEKYLGQNKGKRPMPEFDPYTAEHPEKKAVSVTGSKENAIYNLAESYRLLHYPSKAEPYYMQVLAFNKAKYPLVQYWYGKTERALAKYDEADKAFNGFLDTYKNDDSYAADARKEILDLHFIQTELKKDISLYTVNKSQGLDDSSANYAPTWLNNNTLLFTSTRKGDSAKTSKYINRIYQAVFNGAAVDAIAKMKMPQLQGEHQGIVSITPDGKTIFITRWAMHDGKKIASIYTSSKTADSWSTPVALDSVVNAPGYSAQQPFVMPDGRHLLYASNRGGGMGGFDIWYANLNGEGKPTGTANLGSEINTMYDEQAPYYHEASSTLVFATDGRLGMGGFDLFYAKGDIGKFKEPVNFGYPVNSVKDDIYFAGKGSAKNILEDAMLSSDRSSACCLALFNVHKQIPLKKLSGTVVLCGSNTPAAGATVNVIDTLGGHVVASKTTGADGSYSLTMEDYQPFKIVASSAGYNSDSLHFTVPVNDEVLAVNNPALCLSKIVVPQPPVVTNPLEVGNTIILKNVHFDINKSMPLAESYPSLDTLVGILKQYPSLVIEIGGHTDSKASVGYNARLSQTRAANVVLYLIGKGIAKERLQAKGYGESVPVAPNTNADGTDNPEGRRLNRRTEFKVLSK